MVDVFDQVEEELRSDRYKRLARTWLPVVGAVLLVALVAALSWWGWQTWQTSKADKGSLAYHRGLEAMQANNPIGAEAAFVQAGKEGNGAYRWQALQLRAEIALADNRITDAIALLDESTKAVRDPIMTDNSALKAAWLVMDQPNVTLEDITKRLEPLTGEKRPYHSDASFALAMAQLQFGKTAEARDALVVLKGSLDTPQGVSQQADAALASIDSGTAANLPAIAKAIRDAEAADARAQAAPRAQAPSSPARP